jgi:hypothetical protein
MAEMCAGCAGSFATPADLVLHVKKAHSGGDPRASLSMNPESSTPGVVCALCGRRFASPRALARHALSPHPRAIRPAEPAYARRVTY